RRGHVDREQLGEIGREAARTAVPDLLVVADVDRRALGGLQTGIGERLHRGVHTGDTGLVVKMARANEACIADLDARVEDDKITDLNAERARLVGRGGAGVDAHLVTVLVALELAGVAAVDVDRSLAGDDRAAIGPAIVGVDSDTFTLNGAPGPAAKLGELQAAIRLHLADQRAEGVDVGGQPTRG